MKEKISIRIPDYIHITNKACGECLLFGNKICSTEMAEEMLEACFREERFPECHYVQIAERSGHTVPEAVCCYAFFYLYGERIPAIQEAIEQKHIHIFCIDGLPGMRESGMHICPPYWY